MLNKKFQISFEDGQGLGNQLWLYASVRGISNYHKSNFTVKSYEKFKGKDFLSIDLGDVHETITKKFYEQLYFDKELNNLACIYDELIEKVDCNLELRGYFQSEKYFYNNDNNLSKWIRPSKSILAESTKFKNDVILNIRGGEYKRHKNLLLPKSYWHNSLEILKNKFKFKRILIVTDDKHYSKWLFPSIDVISNGIEECYSALYGAKALAISNSSFAYFPIKTRLDKPFVLAPIYWARYDNKFKRWASPANLYKDWVYLNRKKEIFSYNDLQEEMIKNETDFKKNYKLAFNSKSNVIKNNFYFVPKFIKENLKLFLKTINPKRF